MNSRAARLLMGLYPRGWRQRYGREFEALLAESRGDFRTLANVAWSALLEHILSLRGMNMNRLPRSLATISCAYLAVIAAGLNLYATTDDSSLASAMQTHSGLSAAWTVIELGSIAALGGAIAMLLPLLAAALRFALKEKRGDILLRLLAAPAAVAIFVAWMAGAFFALGEHWAPAPWAIAGDWTAAANWPPVQVRWMVGSITAGLALLLLITASMCVYQAIARTRFEGVQFTVLRGQVTVDSLQWARIPGMVTAVAMLVMTVGVLAWGVIANLDATVAFHGYFGPLHTTAFVSWVGSLCVFALSSVIALRMLPGLRTQAGV
jgi:hypothetical protein